MKRRRIFILDAYNVIYRVPELSRFARESLEKGRDGLIRLCGDWMRYRGDVWRFYVVFDGDSSVVGARGSGAYGVVTMYTRSAETADDRILAVVRERQNDCDCVVVSNDNYVIQHARALNAEVMPVDTFTSTLAQTRERIQAGVQEGKSHLTPAQEKRINDELKQVWGIE